VVSGSLRWRASRSSGALREEEFAGDELSESSREPAGESPVRGDAKVPGSEAPGVGRNAGVEAGWTKWPVRNMK
jgi:hypothetical protein